MALPPKARPTHDHRVCAMTSWITAPAIIPALTAAILIFAWRQDIQRQRIVSIAATLALLAVALGLYHLAGDGVARAYRVGAWPAPYGIVLVLDRLSATMVLLAAVLAVAVLVYAVNGWDARGRHFHALFQFQLLGLNGAFLTGDIFNLFVFFEVMLIASYGLMLHGGGARRLRAGFQYVAINLIASSLFLVAIGLIYAVTGTLNLADLAVKVPQVRPDDQALLHTGALLLLLVFAIKGAFVPLHWWLPATYTAATAPVAALFAIMTKVGAYAIIRVYGLVFGVDAGALAGVATPWIMPAALLTLTVGAIGLVASRTLLDLAAFAIIASMGLLLIALGQFDTVGLTAALYYLVHSTLAGAAMFLIVDLVAQRRGRGLDQLVPAQPVSQAPLLGAFFLLTALAVIGLPPLSGFIGKLMILDASYNNPHASLIWLFVLAASLLMTIAFARAGSIVFWKSEGRTAGPPWAQARIAPLVVVGFLVGTTAALSFFAGPAVEAFAATAKQALDPAGYINAVLSEGQTSQAPGQ